MSIVRLFFSFFLFLVNSPRDRTPLHSNHTYSIVPISGTSFIVIAFMLRLETPKTPILVGIKAVDWVGSFALVGGLLMFLLGLTFGGTIYSWSSPTVICLILFGIITLLVFLAIEQYFARYPLVPVHLYASVSNSAILIVNLFHGIVFTQTAYFLPLYCQSVLGAEPLLSGVLLLPFAVAMSVATVGSGNYLKITGRYLDCIRFGFVLIVLGLGLFCDLPASRTWSKIIIYQIPVGFGVGLNFQPPLIALQNNLHPQDNAAATASFGLVRSVASAIGVVVGSAVFANKMNDRQEELVDVLGISTASLFSGNNAQANVLHIHSLGAPQQNAVHRASWTSIRGIWITAVCFAAAGLLVCLLIQHKKLNETHVEVKTGLAGEEERRRIVMEQRASKR